MLLILQVGGGDTKTFVIAETIPAVLGPPQELQTRNQLLSRLGVQRGEEVTTHADIATDSSEQSRRVEGNTLY